MTGSRADSSLSVLEIVGGSDSMRKVLSVMDRIAPTDASVLISGESGTGKELVARALHTRSRRREGPWVAINCAALPDQLLESELFGHEKGAFTGAAERKQGLLESARGGTFFLDEITEMSLDLQAKLLRVIQERRLRRVGGATEIPIDVRWVTATNREPERAVREGQLRQDLYFRLNVVPIRLPPLRNRVQDIPGLAEAFLQRFGAEYQRPDVAFTPEVMRALQAYAWPGNVRELRNVVERVVSLSTGGPVELTDLPEEVIGHGWHANGNGASSNGTKPLTVRTFHEAKAEVVASFERTYLRELLNRHGGNISQAAREAGIDRKTIHRMLGKYQVDGRG